MVGVAIKLNLYNPAAGGNEFFAKDQRLLLGIPLALLFGIQGSHAFVVDWQLLPPQLGLTGRGPFGRRHLT